MNIKKYADSWKLVKSAGSGHDSLSMPFMMELMVNIVIDIQKVNHIFWSKMLCHSRFNLERGNMNLVTFLFIGVRLCIR